MATLNIGDTVRLKSGGPLMTVEDTQNQNGRVSVWCVWFDAKHNEKRAIFPEDALTPDDGGLMIA